MRKTTHPYAQLDLLPLHLHLVDLEKRRPQRRPLARAAVEYGQREERGTHPEVHANRGTGLVFRKPLLVGEAEEKAALPDGGVPDEEQLHVDGRARLVLDWRHFCVALRYRCRECRLVRVVVLPLR